MLEVERADGIAVVYLAHPKVNALDPELVGRLRETFADLTADATVGAAVLASRNPRTFSAGFDLKRLDTLEQGEFGAFIAAFADLYRELFCGPLPVVAAVGGHALAGGAILALACDRRVVAAGDSRFGVTEVDLGLPIPSGVWELLRVAVGERRAAEAVLFGRLYKPAEALAEGLADRLVPAETLLEEAKAEARQLAEKPRDALRACLGTLRARSRDAMAAADAGLRDEFAEWWFSPEATRRRKAMLAGLGHKGG